MTSRDLINILESIGEDVEVCIEYDSQIYTVKELTMEVAEPDKLLSEGAINPYQKYIRIHYF